MRERSGDVDDIPTVQGIYSGEIDARPHSSHFKYTTGTASERPMTRALGTPHLGQTIPAAERLAMQ